MRSLATAKTYSLVILDPGARRNFQLRADGILRIVCPVNDDIFEATPDPGVQAGIFTYEVHPCRGFPGDALR